MNRARYEVLAAQLVHAWPDIRRVIEAAREADEVISAYVLDRRERDALRMQDVSPKLHAALRELTSKVPSSKPSARKGCPALARERYIDEEDFAGLDAALDPFA